jgi:hypothetical protein
MTVELDTRALEAGMRELARRLDAAAEPAAMRQAQQTASRLRDLVPKRSGRLAATVSSSAVNDGAQVHYGGSLPYASYIDGRTDCVARCQVGAETAFAGLMTAAAATAIRSL